ncbi:MAG: methylmalonyl-CoA mutase family protein, partial [Thermodesulfobacteriota bacterium]|nr:methylmalonyl-CoA mutase family protein [Thermodesulfobacteriota bacterium]
MYSKEVQQKDRNMVEKWEKDVKKMGAENLKSMSKSGFELKPVYTPSDLEGVDYGEISLPGQYPYTRGYYPVHYQVIPPIMSQQMSYGSAKETMERREFLKKLGRRMFVGDEEDSFAMILALDLPTQTGFDADDPVARGKVGECAVSLCTLEAMEEMFKGSPSLNKMATAFIGFNAVEINVAMYAVYCMDIRKEPLDSLMVWPVSEHHCQYFYDIAAYPPAAGLKLKVELVKWLRENCPLSTTYLMDGYNVAEAGATPSFEVALAFAEAINTIEECIKIGLDPDDFLPSFYTHFHLGLNLFEEVAKFRAMRRLWAKIVKDRFRCKNPEAFKLKTYAPQPGGYETTAIEPLNNIIR